MCANNVGMASCQTLRKVLKIYDAGKKYTKTQILDFSLKLC